MKTCHTQPLWLRTNDPKIGLIDLKPFNRFYIEDRGTPTAPVWTLMGHYRPRPGVCPPRRDLVLATTGSRNNAEGWLNMITYAISKGDRVVDLNKA